MPTHNGTDNEVPIDQGALVNMLARYPGQFDVLRELIQNADDAGSTTVELHCETGSQPAGKVRDITEPVRKWIIKNEGTFRQEDWDRIGKIAAGNKDSTKVGAFGVGFYSVLSKSDRPLVKSGGRSLQFYWAKNGKLCNEFLPEQDGDGWTSIELELKKEENLPKLDDLAGFLVSSVALLANIHTITVLLDGERLLRVKKSSDLPDVIPIPEHLTCTSQKNALRIDSIRRTVQTITIDVANWAFPSPSEPSSSRDDSGSALTVGGTHDGQDGRSPAGTSMMENELKHDLYIATISILEKDSPLSKGVESALKSLPGTFKCKGVYFTSDQRQSFVRMTKLSSSKARLFKSIVPENNNGRLFIGQSTDQTTGIGLHISSHYLPTMERGAVDLANEPFKTWNEEVLWISGFLARVIYEEDMRVAGSKHEQAMKFGLETMARFSFGPTFPNGRVSEILQEAFFSCASNPKAQEREEEEEATSLAPFPIVSNTEICCASDPRFRQTNKELSFLKMYLALHPELKSRQSSEITSRYKIPLFRYTDIINEFVKGVPHETMMLFFQWWEGTQTSAFASGANEKTRSAAEMFCEKFTSRSVLISRKGDQVPLKNVKYFTSFLIDDDLSHPESIYIDFSSGTFSRGAVQRFGWTQLSLVNWLTHASSQARNLAQSGDLDVGRRLSRAIVQFSLGSEVPQSQWQEASGLVKDINCIPTNKELMPPGKSYFEEADICGKIPVVNITGFLDFPGIHVVGRGFRPLTFDHVNMVLTKLGVRYVMDWEELLSLLEESASRGSNDRFLHFLHSKGLTESQKNDLKERKVFYSQDHGLQNTSRLHLPSDDIRILGLPVLALPDNGSIQPRLSSPDPAISSPMIDFLGDLGIQGYPSLDTVIDCAASEDQQVHGIALRYFLEHFDKHYEDYDAKKYADRPFIPTKCGSRACLHDVFISPDWGKLKFKQASDNLRSHEISKLGIKEDPAIDTIIKYFKIPKETLPDHDTAQLWFEHLSSHGKFLPAEIKELSSIPFVPVKDPASASSSDAYKYYPPNQCFIGSPNSKEYHRNIFPFVDFGQEGNGFLESCLAKKSPDGADIARMMAEDPQKYLDAVKHKAYLDDLRTIASQFNTIPRETRDAMRKAHMFVGLHGNGHKLLPANKVVISDWENRDFGNDVFLAPEGEVIKQMYHEMGSQYLGAYVRYNIKHTGSREKFGPSLTREQIIRGIHCFMSRQDSKKKTKISFDDKDVMRKFAVKVCKCLKMTKTFTPRSGVPEVSPDCRPPMVRVFPINAGFDPYESTLWLAEASGKPPHLHKDVAIALCSVLLNTFSADDVMRLASMIVMDEEKFRESYPNEPKIEIPDRVRPKGKYRKNFDMGLQLYTSLAFTVMRNVTLLGSWKGSNALDTKTAADEMGNALGMCCSSQDGSPHDFSKPCKPYHTDFNKANGNCTEAHKISLLEKDVPGTLKFFWTSDTHYDDEPPEAALAAFSELIVNLAKVFGLSATAACYIFWDDTNEDLMAFNRDKKFIFFNLYHYKTFFFDKGIVGIDEQKVATEWFLIMAHQIAHNVSQDHDEYHGSLTSRLVLTYLPALRELCPSVGSADDVAESVLDEAGN